jgi:hypothetical protein
VTLTAVTFVDDKSGWAVGHDTVILHTADAGETWTKQFGGGASDNALLTVAFWNADHGLAMGAFFNIGPIGGVSFALKVPDAKAFRSGRHFAAWIGITPRENSTAGRHRPGKISRQGDEDLRRLLVLGATAVIQQVKRGHASPWLLGLLARKPKKLAAVALANKMARIVWAMMVSGETYRRPAQA